MLKIFEAFSGVGSQNMALNNLKKDYKIVATSEIDDKAILAYASINCKDFNKHNKISINREDVMNILSTKLNKNIKFFSKYSDEELIKLYNAYLVSKNMGDITKINIIDIPEHDIFIYSFPCQDISSIGTRKGLDVKSGTRSSLLWECEKIISLKKPKYLIMENVKNLVLGKNKYNFEKWLKILEKNGYKNYWKIFDSQNYGIPQRRPRVIVVSKLNGSKINLIKDNEFEIKKIEDIIDVSESIWKEFKPKSKVKGSIKEGEILFLDDRDWKMNGIMISNISSTQRAGRTGLKFIKKIKGIVYERKLNALECCRLMGFKDSSYYSMINNGISSSNIMKLCGNSIVVPVLENIFKNIYEEEENENKND